MRSERSIYETASGRLLLAYLSEKELDRLIQQNGLPNAETWAEGQTKEGLLAALESIKQTGLVKTHIENRHVKGYAVPVFKNEKVMAGLSVFAPEYRCTPPQEHLIIESLKESAAEIEQKLNSNI